ncbi:MAG TPA: ArsB/NhaD family transporter [Chloroflexota bacterium]|nr:ArsB/NhaD family transporter [Chloroflexota bacterium]
MTLLAAALVVATIALVVARPRGMPESVVAGAAAVLTIGLGLVSLAQAGQVAAGTLGILGFFLGMMTITAVAEQAGVFAWAALWAGHLARGSGQRLLLALFGIGAVITVFLTNDATVLVLTPLVLALVRQLKLPPLAYVLACAWVANAASSMLPVSNPLNVVMLASFPVPLAAYIRYLALPTTVAVIAVYGLLRWRFRRDLARSFDDSALPAPETAVDDKRFFHFVTAALLAIAAAYVFASTVRAPLAAVALPGGALLVLGATALGKLDVRKLGSGISWSIFPFVTGMFVVIQGAENAGLTRQLATLLLAMPRLSPLLGSVGTVLLVAVAANLMNNLPVGLVMISALHQAAGPPPVLLYGTILGADLGPNVSVTGSLAGMLWLIMLRRGGLELSGWRYLRLGLTTTVPALIAAAVVLWGVTRL